MRDIIKILILSVLFLMITSGQSNNLAAQDFTEDGEATSDFILSDVPSIRPVGNWSYGPTQDVEVVDGIAYVSNGCHLSMIDVSSQTSPTFLSTVCFPDIARDSVIIGNLAYVATDGSGLFIVDISDINSPVILGNCDTALQASCVAVVDDLAFIGDRNFGLRIINVSDSESPTEINTYSTGFATTRITARDGEVFLSEQSAGLLRLNTSNPLSLSEIYRYDPGSVSGCVIQGDYAFLACSSPGFIILDLTNTSDPDVVSASLPGQYEGNLAVEGDRAFVLDGFPNFCLLDISNKSEPIVLGEYHEHNAAETITPSSGALIGNYAYLGCLRNGLLILDVQNPAAIYEAGRFTLPGMLSGLDSYGDYVYLAHEYDGMRIIDISDPSNPTKIGWLDSFGGSFSVDATDEYVYIGAGDWGISVVDVDNPSNPVVLGRSEREPYMYGIYADYPYVYVASVYGGFFVIDVSDVTNPSTIYTDETYQYGRDVYCANGFAYLADQSGLVIYNVTNPASPSLANFYGCPGSPYGVFATNDIAYVASWGGGLRILNVTDPYNPYELGYWNTITTTNDIWVDRNLAYVSCYQQGVRILNVTDPSMPVEVGSIPAISYTEDVRFSNGILMVADTQSSLWMYEHDLDGDGLYSVEEAAAGTNPGLADSDGDTLSDYDELYTYFTIPSKRDSDDDLLDDNEEINIGTNPMNEDSDFDLMPDGWEVTYGLDPLTDDAGVDVEGDLRNNLQEYLNRSNPLLDDVNPVLVDLEDRIVYKSIGCGVLVWTASEGHPAFYELHMNETMMRTNLWNSSLEAFSIDLDALDPGFYSFNLTVYDSESNSATDCVNVTIKLETNTPLCDSPHDISLYYGSVGNMMTWTTFDDNPSEYTIYLEGVPIASGPWNDTYWVISINLDGYDIGMYNFTLEILDTDGHFITDTVFLSVLEDTQPPNVSIPQDISFEEGEEGYSIVWLVSDNHPAYYIIFKDGSVMDLDDWDIATTEITVDLYDLNVGVYNFTLLVSDGVFNVTDTVFVTVYPHPLPELDSPNDILYEAGSTGNVITWTLLNGTPTWLKVYRNGTLIASYPWEGSYFTQNVDSLSPATYNFTMRIQDAYGNYDSDSVWVTVTQSTTLTSTTETTTSNDTTGTSAEIPDIMPLLTLIITLSSATVVIVVLLLIIRNRRAGSYGFQYS